ncbi:transglutaminase domain-containing protein [Marininema halotolerans]|uniref:Transglutaminase-like superfamily protein n=1 Tax=Marininema halotolerans TaxID=1155944 RepID=A0A1I6SGE4_9BACL|nr:transglutaminase-like domain-containing protein [Marininema halotolerans]SFS76061.1 Transglutaminase-like superfamily protein [Marininema halotolerans]
MNIRTGRWSVLLMTLLLVFSSGCNITTALDTDTKQHLSKYDALAQKKNDQLDLEPLKLEPYAREVGGKISAPQYRKFAANSSVLVKGSATKHADFRSNVAWIEVEKVGADGNRDERKFSYYARLKKGHFSQQVQLFAGTGSYQVTVRLPGKEREDRFYDLAQFEVINVNPLKKRDLAYTRIGTKIGLTVEEPRSGLVKKKKRFELKGKIRQPSGNRVMIRLEKDGQRWQHLIPVKDGTFTSEVPLFYGRGIHKITVLSQDKDRSEYYNEAVSMWVDNQLDVKQEPIQYFKHYDERGVKLEAPLVSGGSGKMKYQIKGHIDPEAPFAKETKHLIVQTKKGDQEATYFIPVKDGRFNDTFWLRFGKGDYEVTVNVPEITNVQRDYFRFFGVARFHVTNTEDQDLRNLLPSRGIQSDNGTIRSLAEELTRNKQGDRAKVFAIYQYVSKNIRYDVAKFKHDAFEYDDSALKTLHEKDGVCQDYSFLAIALLRSIDIESRFIEGMAEGNRHAWVEVKVKGSWITMDPTWGAGYINGSDQFVQRYTTKYFDPSPREFARTHSRTGVMY